MSAIEWTDETWNPLTGCARVSPGCDNCYAARDAAGRLRNHPAYQGLAVRPPAGPAEFTGEIRLHPDRLDQPLRWRRPRRIFVNSMSDLFHPDVPVEFIQQVWDTMAATPQHTYQVLTKRPQRMRDLITTDGRHADGPLWTTRHDVPLPNVWLGTSIESNRYTFRADHLRATPAAVRFLSLEPLLGPVPSLDLTGIDWVIVGGESGPGARPMHPHWVRDIRDRCVVAGVPFFFKQWGRWAPIAPVHPDSDDQAEVDAWDQLTDYDQLVALEPSGAVPQTISPDRCDYQPAPDSWWLAPLGKKAAGRQLEGRTWDQTPTLRVAG